MGPVLWGSRSLDRTCSMVIVGRRIVRNTYNSFFQSLLMSTASPNGCAFVHSASRAFRFLPSARVFNYRERPRARARRCYLAYLISCS